MRLLRAKRGGEFIRVDSHESFCQLGPKERKLSSTHMNLNTFKVEESACDFQAKRQPEFELSLSLSPNLILGWPVLKGAVSRGFLRLGVTMC